MEVLYDQLGYGNFELHGNQNIICGNFKLTRFFFLEIGLILHSIYNICFKYSHRPVIFYEIDWKLECSLNLVRADRKNISDHGISINADCFYIFIFLRDLWVHKSQLHIKIPSYELLFLKNNCPCFTFSILQSIQHHVINSFLGGHFCCAVITEQTWKTPKWELHINKYWYLLSSNSFEWRGKEEFQFRVLTNYIYWNGRMGGLV